MRERVVVFCLGLVCWGWACVWAQPKVPSRVRFADLRLHLSSSAQREIQQKVDKLVLAGGNSVEVKTRRAEMYFPIIERVFEEEDLPEDFKYLAIQESALIGNAVSSANAVGFWQFKIPAAKEVGLRIDHYVDERKHIVFSTRGAARYLKRNNFFYSNWVYALTAYNTGRGGAEAYIEEKYLGKKEMKISKRTHWYVKTFLAHVIAFREELTHRPKKKPLYLLEYHQGGGKTLNSIAQKFDLQTAALAKYNLWLKKGKVPEDYVVLVPSKELRKLPNPARKKRSHAKALAKKKHPKARLLTHPMVVNIKKRLAPSYLYSVRVNGLRAIISRKRERMSDLVARSGLLEKRFLAYNDLSLRFAVRKSILAPNPGQVYYLERKKGRAHIHYHVVRRGENWWSISQDYGLRAKKLALRNRMSYEEDTLKAGMVLWLRKTRPRYMGQEFYEDILEPVIKHAIDTVQKVKADTVRVEPKDSARYVGMYPHWMEEGQTLYGVSRAYGVTVEEIMAWNDIDDPNNLPIGTKVYLNIVPPDTTVIVPVFRERVPYDSLVKERERLLTELRLWQADSTRRAQMPNSPLVSTPPPPTESKRLVHVVGSGETLYGIAQHYGVSVEEIMKLNSKEDDYSLRAGEELLIREGEEGEEREE